MECCNHLFANLLKTCDKKRVQTVFWLTEVPKVIRHIVAVYFEPTHLTGTLSVWKLSQYLSIY